MRKLKIGMTIDEKLAVLMSEPDAALTISIRYWDLFDELNIDVANKFKQRIYEIRGILGRRLAIIEVEKLYEKFRTNEIDDFITVEFKTRADCMLDLNVSYGRFASRKLCKVLNEKEEKLGRKLSREEIPTIYRELGRNLQDIQGRI